MPKARTLVSTGPALQVDESEAMLLVQRLIAVRSRSREERPIMEAIRTELSAAGVPDSAMVHDNAHQQSAGEIGNLIVKLPGQVKAPRRLLMAHVDTVPICLGAEPFVDGDWIRSRNPETGLGGDDRAGVAVVITALKELLRQKLPHPPLTLFFPVQEEIGLYGARYVSVNKLGAPKLCFNWDGGEPTMACIGATGDYGLEIQIDGRASHAGVHPERGINAAVIASIAIADLVENGWHGLIQKGKHSGTSNVGMIAGGDATNVVMPRLDLRAEVRSHDPKFRFKIVEAYQKAFMKAVKRVKADDGSIGNVRFTADLKYESFLIDPSEPVVQIARTAIESVGLQAGTCTSNGGLDANWMSAHGFPTVTLGCGQHDIHTVNECLHVPTFLTACRIGTTLASGLVG